MQSSSGSYQSRALKHHHQAAHASNHVNIPISCTMFLICAACAQTSDASSRDVASNARRPLHRALAVCDQVYLLCLRARTSNRSAHAVETRQVRAHSRQLPLSAAPGLQNTAAKQRSSTARCPSFGPMTQFAVHVLKAWLATRVSLRLARLPRTASSAQRSCRLRSTRAAAPGLLAHAEVTKP